MNFETLRQLHPDIIGDQEPGDMISDPYHLDHIKATEVERIFTKHNKIDWDEYEETIQSL